MPVIASIRNILYDFNYSNFTADPVDYAMTPFQTYVGLLMWPIIMAGVIGVVYRETDHMSTTVAAIFIVFALFGSTNAFIQSPEISQWFFIVAVLGWAGVVLTLFVKKRYEN